MNKKIVFTTIMIIITLGLNGCSAPGVQVKTQTVERTIAVAKNTANNNPNNVNNNMKDFINCILEELLNSHKRKKSKKDIESFFMGKHEKYEVESLCFA